MKVMKHFALSLAVLLAATYAAAQDVSTLNPIARSYGILGFGYPAPKGDGWREIGSGPDYVQLIYAEQLGPDTINTRLAFEAHAFLIPDPSKAPDASVLAQLSMSQRMQEFKDAQQELVAMSKIEPVQADVPMFQYTLVVKFDEKDRFVNYFVAMAADKSQYFAAKLETQENDFRDQPYYAPLLESLTALKFVAADKPKSDGATKPDNVPAPGVKN